ncbi:SpoIIE family protein phosphatase [Posidoniimonas corsicana]|nr:SpoIIE family protein phosphatase [Posidoniimonas corsicana]
MADICAGGEGFAELSNDLRSLMKRNVNRLGQNACVAGMSKSLADASEHGCFASSLLATYFSPRRSLTICNAGHPPPLLFRDAEKAWIALSGSISDSGETHSDTVLRSTEYHEVQTRLSVGDVLLYYSGSLVECVDAHSDLLGIAGIRKLAERLVLDGTERLAARLLSEVQATNPRILEAGDATVIVCRATKRAVGWKANLLAPLRMFRRVADQVTFL